MATAGGFGAAGFDPIAAVSAVLGAGAPATAVAGGLTTMVGGTTVTVGFALVAPAGALATTAPAGGFEAIAGALGGTIAGAGRGCGTILRGSGRAGGVGGVGVTLAAGGAGLETGFAVTAVAALLGGTRLLRASASCSCFLARIAFITSPGLETCDRSIFGVMVCAAREELGVWPAPRDPCWKCARTLSASCSSIELECVLPSARPSSARISRTWRLLTSNSRARSLIRTLLIRLFSAFAAQSPLVAHGYLLALACCVSTIITERQIRVV